MPLEVGVAMVVEMGSGDVLLEYGKLKSGKPAINFHQMDEAKEPGFVPDNRPEGPSFLSIRFSDADAIDRLVGNLQYLKAIMTEEKE